MYFDTQGSSTAFLLGDHISASLFSANNSTTNAATGHPIGNVYNTTTTTRFVTGVGGKVSLIWDAGSGKTLTVDSLGLASCSFTGTATLGHASNPSGAAFTQVLSIENSGSNHIYRIIGAASARCWRLEFEDALQGEGVAHIAIGESMIMPRSLQPGFSPPSVAGTKVERAAQVAVSGRLVGSYGFEIAGTSRMNFPNISLADYPTVKNLVDRLNAGDGLLMSWDYKRHNSDIGYVVVANGILNPQLKQGNFLDLALDITYISPN